MIASIALIIVISCVILHDIYSFSIKQSLNQHHLNHYSLKFNNNNNIISKKTYLNSNSNKVDDKTISTSDAAARQLLGIKGASENKNIWAIRLQLCKPVTWIPLIWGVACGAAASGNYHTWNPFSNDNNFPLIIEDLFKAITCMILSGPILTGYTQTLNDWEDRAIDAINEPYRPIPSGAISEGQVIAQILVLLLSGIGLSFVLDQWAGHGDDHIITKLVVFGSFISYIYSAPPLKLKATGWAGSFALGNLTYSKQIIYFIFIFNHYQDDYNHEYYIVISS